MTVRTRYFTNYVILGLQEIVAIFTYFLAMYVDIIERGIQTINYRWTLPAIFYPQTHHPWKARLS